VEWLIKSVEWMQWSIYSVLGFSALFVTLIGMAIWESFVPSIRRKGFLPITSTRGERLFIGMISTIGLCLLWIALFKGTFMFVPLIISALWFFIVARWG